MATLYTILETPEILERLVAFWPKSGKGRGKGKTSTFYTEITAITQECKIKWIMQRADIVYNGGSYARSRVAALGRVQVVLGQGRPAVTESHLLSDD